MKKIFIYFYLILISSFLFYPFLFIFIGSFATVDDYYCTRLLPLPRCPTLTAYRVVLQPTLLLALHITLLRVIWYVCLALLTTLMGGYVFSRLHFPGKQMLLMFFLGGLAIPPILTCLPVYIMLAHWPLAGGNNLWGQGGHGLVNEWPVLFILGVVDAFGLFLLKQNYDMFPFEYEEAAIMDGSGFFTTIFCIYAPMLKPALSAIAIVAFVTTWNDYFYPFLFVSGNEQLVPIALRVQKMIQGMSSWGSVTTTPFPTLFAAATLMCLPPILLYVALQRFFVQGLVGIGIR